MCNMIAWFSLHFSNIYYIYLILLFQVGNSAYGQYGELTLSYMTVH